MLERKWLHSYSKHLNFSNQSCLVFSGLMVENAVIDSQDHGMLEERKVRWIQPRRVPKCLLLHLKTFEWRDYEGTEVEKEVAVYVLNNAKRLVTATIYPFSVSLVRKRKMFEEVEIATRSSRSCALTMGLEINLTKFPVH